MSLDEKNEIGNNIIKAFSVVNSTYRNCEKLMQAILNEYPKDKLSLACDKYLRWHSDSDYNGWYINSFILLFQRFGDGEENVKKEGLLNAPIYAVEINFDKVEKVNEEGYIENIDIPRIFIAKMYYKDINNWGGIGQSEHGGFYHPIHTHKEWWKTEKKSEYFYRIPIKEHQTDIDKAYWGGLEKVIYTYMPLMDINGENYPCIFEKINDLATKE